MRTASLDEPELERLPPLRRLPRVPSPLALDAPTEGISLEQAIHLALVHQPAIRAAMESVAQAQGDAVTASLAPNPTVNSEITLLPLTRPFIADEREGGPPQWDYFWVSYPLDWLVFGKRLAEMQSAALEVQVARAQVADTIRTRLADTAVAYIDVLENEALLRLIEGNLEFALLVYEESLRVEAAAPAAEEGSGAVPRADRRAERARRRTRFAALRQDGGAEVVAGALAIERQLLRIEVVHFRRDLVEQRAALAASRAQLAELLAWPGEPSDLRLGGSLAAPALTPPLDPALAVALAQRSRPDLLAARRQVEKSHADTLVERRAARPEVEIRAGLTKQYQERALGFPDANSYGGGIEFSVPLFDRNQGNIQRAEAAVRQMQAELRGLELEVRSEVQQALAEFEQAYRILSEQNTDLLHALVKLREVVYETLEDDDPDVYLDMLEAVRSYHDGMQLYITTHADYWRAYHRLQGALGGSLPR